VVATWTVDKNGEQIDASPEQIREWLDRGEINKYTQVFIEGNADWVNLGTVVHLLPQKRKIEPDPNGWGAVVRPQQPTKPQRATLEPAVMVTPAAGAASTRASDATRSRIPLRSSSGSDLSDFLNFRKMLTPLIVKIIFWLSVVGFVLSGFVSIVGGLQAIRGGGLMMVLIGLGTLVFGPIVARIYCEILMVAFSINDSLADIRRAMLEKN